MRSLRQPDELYPFKGEFKIASQVMDILIDHKIDLVITLHCTSQWFARRAKQVIAIGAKDRDRLSAFRNVISMDYSQDLVATLLPTLTNRRVLAYIGLEASPEETKALDAFSVAAIVEHPFDKPANPFDKSKETDYWKKICTEFPSYVPRFNWQELYIPGPVPVGEIDRTVSKQLFRYIYSALKILSQVTVDSIDVAEQGSGRQAQVLFALAPLFSVRIGNFDLNPDGSKTYHIGLVDGDPLPLLLAGSCEKVYDCEELRDLPIFQRTVRAWPLPNLIKPKERLIQFQLSGGLGNQLFQIANGLHYAKEQQARVVFSLDLLGHRPDNWAQHFGLPCQAFQAAKLYREPEFTYHSLPPFFDKITVTGYFQCDSYFDREIESILEPFLEKAKRLFNYPANSRALHIRRGDYTHCPAVHPCAPLEYYREVIGQTEGPLLIFSDDLDWCRQQFPGEQCVTIGDPLMELLVMSQCKTIIAANSTFSWWAGFLSKPGTLVSLPKVWFGPKGPQDWRDIYYRKLYQVKELDHGWLYRQVDPSCEFAIYQGNDTLELLRKAKENGNRFAVIAKPEFHWENDRLFRQQIKRIASRYSGLSLCGLIPNGIMEPCDELVSYAIDSDLSQAFLISCYKLDKSDKIGRKGLITTTCLGSL